MNRKKLNEYIDFYKNSSTKFLTISEFISYIERVYKIENKKCLIYIFEKIEHNVNITNFIREYRRNRNKNFLKGSI